MNEDVRKTTLGCSPWATGVSDCMGHAGYCDQKLDVLLDLGWKGGKGGGIPGLKSHRYSLGGIQQGISHCPLHPLLSVP